MIFLHMQTFVNEQRYPSFAILLGGLVEVVIENTHGILFEFCTTSRLWFEAGLRVKMTHMMTVA